MNDTNQNKPLQLADALEREYKPRHRLPHKAATELRRLAAENEQLRASLEQLQSYPQPKREPLTPEQVHAAFAAARKNGMHLTPVEATRAIERAHKIGQDAVALHCSR